MVSVKFYCPNCKKEYHIDELKYWEVDKTYYCPNELCDTPEFEIRRKD